MNKKAFTLIELLAVIIIIGLIAVITLPKINDSLENSKKNLSTTSAQGYAKAIDEYILKKQMNKEKINLNGTYNIDENGILYNELNEYELEYTGEKPKSGTLTYINNELQSACITMNKYAVTLTNGEVTNIEKGQCQYTRILTRNEIVFALVDDYIEEFEDTSISSSGLYMVTDINNDIVDFEEYPTNGWIKIKYKENGEITILDYSLKFGNQIVNLENSQKTLANQLKQTPERVCPDPECNVDDNNIFNQAKMTKESINEKNYICNIYNSEKYCLQYGINETSPSPVFDNNKSILDNLYESCNYANNNSEYTCTSTETISGTEYQVNNYIEKNGAIYIDKRNTGKTYICKTSSNSCYIETPEF